MFVLIFFGIRNYDETIHILDVTYAFQIDRKPTTDNRRRPRLVNLSPVVNLAWAAICYATYMPVPAAKFSIMPAKTKVIQRRLGGESTAPSSLRYEYEYDS